MKQDNLYLKKYCNIMTNIMLKLNPEWDEETVRNTIMKMIKKNIKNPRVTLDNNYTGESRDTTLLSVLDWVFKRKPIICGNATFYKNQHEAINPIAKMLKNFLSKRKSYKKMLFSVADSLSREYKDFDRKQLNEKVNCNSYYGASGAPSSAFYSVWSGPATTYSAQSVISTCETLFEGFIADNYLYLDVTECIEWCRRNLKEFKNQCYDDFLTKKTPLELTERLMKKIINKDDMDEEIILSFVYSLSEEEISLLYYKNNLIKFIDDHEEIKDLIINIFENVENLSYADTKDETWSTKIFIPEKFLSEARGKTAKEWNSFVNKEYFMDPNNVPESIANDLYILKSYIIKYVYCRYLSVDRIYRLRNFKRKVVTVIDTDSNILSLDTCINWLFDNVIKGREFQRDHLNNIFICVNMLANILTDAVTDILLTYGEYSNVPEEFRPIYAMKNEFLFLKLVIGEAKKRYISRIVLREGNLMNPPKYDIKGFDFKKSTCSEYAEKVYMDMIKKYILDPEEIMLKDIIKELSKFKETIRSSIEKGERTYLPNGNAKELSAYKNPESEQSVRGVIAWNILNPDNMIDLPAKVSLVKLNIFKEEDIEDLKKDNLEIYNLIVENIFHDTTGIFVSSKHEIDKVDTINPKDPEWYKKIPKKYRTKWKKLGAEEWNKFAENYNNTDDDLNGHYEYKHRGLSVLAIPSNATIPEWVIPYIDYSTMINNIISPFIPVIEIFKSKTIEEGKTVNGINRKTESFSKYVKF